MAIEVGASIPEFTMKRLGAGGMEEVTRDQVFAGRKVVLFAVPGAFTPACTAQHLPGYVRHAADFKAKGVDEIACVAVNDPFVMKAWADQAGAGDAVAVLPDWDAAFSRALGLTFDASGAGLGTRAQRFALVADNGVVSALAVENGTEVNVSAAEKILVQL